MFHGQWQQSTRFAFMVILASMVIAISAPAVRAADQQRRAAWQYVSVFCSAPATA
jgi:hypothetical protein